MKKLKNIWQEIIDFIWLIVLAIAFAIEPDEDEQAEADSKGITVRTLRKMRKAGLGL